MNDERDEEQGERPRPRVVDKRISAGQERSGGAAEDPSSASTEEQPSPTEPSSTEGAPPPSREGSEGAPRRGAGRDEVWTPQQEAEAQRLAEEMARIPALDWVANTAVTLVNVAATKLHRDDLAEARLAIDALAALISGLGDRLGEVHAPLRGTLAQLQMAYAEKAGPPPAG